MAFFFFFLLSFFLIFSFFSRELLQANLNFSIYSFSVQGYLSIP